MRDTRGHAGFIPAVALSAAMMLVPPSSTAQTHLEATNAAKLQTYEYFLLPRADGGTGAALLQPFSGQGLLIQPPRLPEFGRPTPERIAERFGRQAQPGTPVVIADDSHPDLSDAIVPTKVLGSGGVAVEFMDSNGAIVMSTVPARYLPRRERSDSAPGTGSVLLGLLSAGGFSRSEPYYAAFADERGIVIAYFGDRDFDKLNLPGTLRAEGTFNPGILIDLAIVGTILGLLFVAYRRKKASA